MSKKICSKCGRYIEHKGKEKYCPNCMKSIYQRIMAPKVGGIKLKPKSKNMRLETEETPTPAEETPTETPAEEAGV